MQKVQKSFCFLYRFVEALQYNQNTCFAYFLQEHKEESTEVNRVTKYNNLNDVLKYANSTNEEIFIIGGASIYKQFINYFCTSITTSLTLDTSSTIS